MKVYQVIKRNEDFRKVYSNGISKANRLLVMYILKNEKTPATKLLYLVLTY